MFKSKKQYYRFANPQNEKEFKKIRKENKKQKMFSLKAKNIDSLMKSGELESIY